MQGVTCTDMAIRSPLVTHPVETNLSTVTDIANLSLRIAFIAVSEFRFLTRTSTAEQKQSLRMWYESQRNRLRRWSLGLIAVFLQPDNLTTCTTADHLPSRPIHWLKPPSNDERTFPTTPIHVEEHVLVPISPEFYLDLIDQYQLIYLYKRLLILEFYISTIVYV